MRAQTTLIALSFIVPCGCGARAVAPATDADAPDPAAAPDAFCQGPPKIAFDFGLPLAPDSVEAHWAIASGPASPAGGLAVYSRMWIEMAHGMHDGWDWYNETGVSVGDTVDFPSLAPLDLAHLPPGWTAWSDHGLAQALPDVDKPFSTARGHRFSGTFSLRGSPREGGTATICLFATRAADESPTTIQVYAGDVPFPALGWD